jgi:hypothetical protein
MAGGEIMGGIESPEIWVMGIHALGDEPFQVLGIPQLENDGDGLGHIRSHRCRGGGRGPDGQATSDLHEKE